MGYALANWPDFYHKNDVFLIGEKRIKSVIILLAAEMHRNSINYYLCGYLLNLFSNTITITAVFFLTYIITNNKIISILCSVFLILIFFPNVHNYGIKYINYYIYLGNFAFWLSILIISLHLKEFNKTKNVLLSLLFFTHVYWFFFVIVNLFFDLYINKKKIIIKNLFFFLLPFLILFFYINNNFLINDFNFNTFFSFKSLDTSTLVNSNTIALEIDHNIFFQNKNFFEKFNTLIFLLSFNSLFLINTYKNYYSFSKHHKNLCKMFLFSLVGIFIFLLYLNVDKNLFFIKFILGDLALHFHKIYPIRFLNIIIIYVCIIIFLNIMNIIHKKNILFYIFLLLIILSLISKFFYDFYIYFKLDIFSFIFYLVGLFLIFFSRNLFLIKYKKINKALMGLILLCSITQIFMTRLNDKSITDSNYKIFKNIEKLSLNLIGPNIYARNHNHIYKMLNAKVIFPTNNKIKIDEQNFLFLCKNTNFNQINKYYTIIKNCFEKRSRNDWIKIKNKTGIENIFVTADYKLNLDIISENDYIKFYKLK